LNLSPLQRTTSQNLSNPLYFSLCLAMSSSGLSTSSPSPILGNIAELCIVSPDIYSTIDGFTKIGMGPFQVFDFNPTSVIGQELHGEHGPDLFRLKVAFAKQNSVVVEIMQPTGGNSLMQSYLDQNGGKEGVQHVAWDMDHVPMEERQKMMKERGFEPVMQGVWRGRKGTCHFCFFDTLEKGIGTVFETIEFSKDWEDPDCEWYPSQPGP
jgi:methylmalonyl-CoA/ethylmalonyl-CoA epimerase